MHLYTRQLRVRQVCTFIYSPGLQQKSLYPCKWQMPTAQVPGYIRLNTALARSTTFSTVNPNSLKSTL